jgi:hypothetical protein
LVDKTEGDFEIGEGVKLVQTEETSQGRSLNDIELSDDEETREGEVDSLLVDRVARFLGSHTLQFKVPKDSIKDVQRSLEEGKLVNEIHIAVTSGEKSLFFGRGVEYSLNKLSTYF